MVAALRKYTVGIDTEQFYGSFNEIGQSKDWLFEDFRYEFGFNFLSKILYIIFGNPQSLIIITSIFVNFSVYNFIKSNSKNYFLSTLLFILLNFFFSYMNIMRQALAISILLLGYKEVNNRHYIKYAIYVLIAFLFHKTALLGIGIIFLKMLSDKNWLKFVIPVIGVFLFVFYRLFFNLIAGVLGTYYLNYGDSSFGVSNYFGSLIVFAQSFILFFIILLYKRKFTNNINNFFNLDFYLVLVSLICNALVMQMNIFNRLSFIFDIYLIIFIPNSINLISCSVSSSNRMRNVIRIDMSIIFLFISFLSFFVISIFRPEWYGVIPYEFFFQ